VLDTKGINVCSDAPALLARLNQWLQTKNRGLVCSEDSACAASTGRTNRKASGGRR
jgi:hypothetical protein